MARDKKSPRHESNIHLKPHWAHQLSYEATASTAFSLAESYQLGKLFQWERFTLKLRCLTVNTSLVGLYRRWTVWPATTDCLHTSSRQLHLSQPLFLWTNINRTWGVSLSPLFKGVLWPILWQSNGNFYGKHMPFQRLFGKSVVSCF